MENKNYGKDIEQLPATGKYLLADEDAEFALISCSEITLRLSKPHHNKPPVRYVCGNVSVMDLRTHSVNRMRLHENRNGELYFNKRGRQFIRDFKFPIVYVRAQYEDGAELGLTAEDVGKPMNFTTSISDERVMVELV